METAEVTLHLEPQAREGLAINLACSICLSEEITPLRYLIGLQMGTYLSPLSGQDGRPAARKPAVPGMWWARDWPFL